MDHDEYIRIICEEHRILKRLEFADLCGLGKTELLSIIATLSGVAIGIYSVIDLIREVAKK